MSAMSIFLVYWIVLLVASFSYILYLYVLKPMQKNSNSFVEYSTEEFNNFIERVDTIVLQYFYGGVANNKILKRINGVKNKQAEVIHAKRSVKNGIKNSGKTLREASKEFVLALLLLQEELYAEPELYLLWRETVTNFGLDKFIDAK